MHQLPRLFLLGLMLFGLGLASGCGAADASPRTAVVVLAAASLTDALSEIETLYEQAHPETDLMLSFGGSQVCAAQIIEGAPAGVFCSADRRQVRRVVDAGLMGGVEVFATNRLVVVEPGGDGGDRSRSAAEILKAAGGVVLGSPEVPAGRYARLALESMGLWDGVEPRVVSYEDDVRGVLAKIVMGEADAGIVYATDALAAPAGTVRTTPLEGGAQTRVEYVLGVSVEPAQRDGGGALFAAFLLQSDAQRVLARHGFSAP